MPTANHAVAVQARQASQVLSPSDRIISCGFDWTWCFIVFADIDFAPGFCVSSEGTVWSRWKIRAKTGMGRRAGTERYLSDEWHQIKGSPGNHGYLAVGLGHSNKHTIGGKHLIHNLVLEFLYKKRPVSDERIEARHLSGNKRDNRLLNLIWGTVQQNQQDRVAHGTSNRGSRHGNSKLNEANVLSIVHEYKIGKEPAELALIHGVLARAIYCVLKGETWSHLTGIAPGSPLLDLRNRAQ